MKTIFVFLLLFAITGQVCRSNDNNQSPDPNSSGRFDNLPQDVILLWNETALEAMGGDACLHSHYGAYVNVMMHLAMHNALNGIEPKFETYHFDYIDRNADPVAAASKAAHTVLSTLLPEACRLLDLRLKKVISALPEGSSKTRGINLGMLAGEEILITRGKGVPNSFLRLL